MTNPYVRNEKSTLVSKKIFCRAFNLLRPDVACYVQRGRNEIKTLQLTYVDYCVKPQQLTLLICFLLISLSACSTTSSPTNTQLQPTVSSIQHLSPTPTTPRAGIVLYQANWSHGLPRWQNLHGWKVVQGQLETDTGGPATFTLPYIPTVADYALEIRIQIVRLINENGGYFSLSAPQLPGKNGYATGVSGMEGTQPRPNGSHPSAQISLQPTDSLFQGTGRPIDFEPHFVWHTYRIEVQDNEVSFFSDGVSLVDVSSDQTDTLSNGPIAFKSDELILRISSLRVLTL